MEDGSLTVILQDIVDAIEAQTEEMTPYLNTETGKIVYNWASLMDKAEESGFNPDAVLDADPDQEDIRSVIDIERYSGTGKYLRLPDTYAIDEYRTMMNFCSTISDRTVSEAMFTAIQGKGSFRRFKDSLIHLGLREQWFKFRDDRILTIARQWCEINGLSYTE